MKITSLFIFVWLSILCILSPAFGQRKFSLAVSLGYSQSHSDYKSIVPIPDPITQLSPTELVASSNGKGYGFGLLVRYAFSPKWSVNAGIAAGQSLSAKGYFSQNGTRISVNYTNTHRNEFAYSIPVQINYQSSTKRLSPYFSVGASLGFRAKSYVDLGNGQEVAVKFGEPVTITPGVGVGVIYRLNEHYSLLVQPGFSYNVQAHPTYVYYHAYSVGLSTQLLYTF
ncbi:outer membrane beta-barrel protein [Spirosoma sp. KCTC 42546]|uniref:outer membrane beta-barrel protein n=1 Tax=Spirosoma sp. KCTC 42546 TaxID=2520506 RepID=UPI00115A80FD|nr:outer membrane beta-barrel protein [Spirosoma sp. KCTC 42546]QDK80905.1 outer membrane beta-barrel protein [Spirosoma sp. KCTC 42546]